MTELVRIALQGQAPAPEFRRRARERFERALDVHLAVRRLRLSRLPPRR